VSETTDLTHAPDHAGSWTRGRFLRAALGGGAVVSGGIAFGSLRDDTAPGAATAPAHDAEVLNLFLTLEYVQQAFYEQAVRSGRLGGRLLEYARTVAGQEAQHVAMLRERLGSRADARPKSNAGDATSSPEEFQTAAVDLEEAVLAAFVGQGANLSKSTIVPVTTLISVEARQAGWIRDLAGVLPAPRAADPARKPDDVLDELRKKGLLA
jgi:Ferritin-like domain